MAARRSVPGSDWTALVPVAELARRGGCLVVRKGRHRIALFDTPAGLRACANRCPHEGYPLAKGSVAVQAGGTCVLTCNWHNWKFDLASGDNLMQGEGVRVYPLRVRDGVVEADLAEPDPAVRRAAVMNGLRHALDDHDYTRIAREQARYEQAGGDALDPLRDAIHRSHERLRFGWTHAYAACADWLQLRERLAGDAEAGLGCLTEALAYIAWDTLREPRYRFARRARRWDEAGFLAAVEAEDEPAAVALVRGGLRDGDASRLEPALTRAALAHYNDFGHSLIYVTKAMTLVERLGEPVAEPLLASLVRGIVYATREDLVPDFRDYAGALAAMRRGGGDARLPSLAELGRLGTREVLRRVAACGAAPGALHRRLLGACAEALLAFDTGHEARTRGAVDDNVGWLDFTHALTFGSAARRQCARFPDQWPAALLQMACFLGRNRAYRLARVPLARWRVRDEAAFWRQAEAGVLDHGRDDYIASVHRLKTMLAVREEVDAMPGCRERVLLLAALNRFLAAPMKRRHVLRDAHQALRFAALEG